MAEAVAILGSLLILLSLLGLLIPVIPGGAILSYISILLWVTLVPEKPLPLEEVGEEPTFTLTLIIVLGVIHALALIGDFFIPWIGSKFFKFSSSGVWGSVVGMVVGFFFFPPFGIILGGILGTLVGELYHGKKFGESLQITSYTALLNLGVFLFKFILTLVTTFYFVSGVWQYFF